MRPTNENSLGDVLKEMFRKYHLEDGLWSAKIEYAWGTCIAAPIVQRTNSLVFKNGLLIVYVNSSVVRNELVLMKEEIISQLNAELGELVIRELTVY